MEAKVNNNKKKVIIDDPPMQNFIAEKKGVKVNEGFNRAITPI